ncbi:MAG: hypothetical protein RMJ15_07830, partial [Nitrososphaerota archaeon]|nr:hypothetical protein [Nitrososphaerota archaeon]
AALLLYSFLFRLNEWRLFYKLFAFNCLAMPFVLSLIWIWACRFWNLQVRNCGFSGIASAFLGASVFAYALFLHVTLKVNVLHACMSTILFFMLVFTLTYFPPTSTITATVILLLASFILFACKTVKSIDPQAKNKLQEKIKNPKIATITVSLLPLFLYLIILAFSPILFPTQIFQGNRIVNVLLHFAGFVLGISTARMLWQHSQRQRVN